MVTNELNNHLLDTQQNTIIALHTSAVQTPGGALLFLGHAGAGKSTISRLLSGRYPIISDDSVYLTQQGEKWVVAHADYSAFFEDLLPQPPFLTLQNSTDRLDWFPLLAIIRIFQAQSAQIVSVNDMSTCKHLADAAFEIPWQQQSVERVRLIFSTVAQIARMYPGWELSFTMDDETVKVVSAHFG